MNRPEPNRLIQCWGTCSPGTPFECFGMWVPYKSPPNRPGTGRFMIRLRNGSFEADRDTWLDVESWEYVDGEQPRAASKPKENEQ